MSEGTITSVGVLNGEQSVTLTWRDVFKRERDEQEAMFQFMPAEHVAHVAHKTRADLRVECKVTWGAPDKFAWQSFLMQMFGGPVDVFHTGKSGCESSYGAACLAAYTAAKELADGK